MIIDPTKNNDVDFPLRTDLSRARNLGVKCKICGAKSTLKGEVDFNINCNEIKGTKLPCSGLDISYMQCTSCKLLFTCAFDDWTREDFQAHIYNDEYAIVDPDYLVDRPTYFAMKTLEFCKPNAEVKLLDFGGGNGLLASLLRERGLDASCWDPMIDSSFTPAEKAYDLVTAFEVMEHTPTPKATASQALSYLKPEGALLFSTHTFDNVVEPQTGFWYVAPRNGHITLHTQKSLKSLFKPLGYRVHHFNEDIHIAYKNLPRWIDLDHTPFSESGLRYRFRRLLRKAARLAGL